MTVCLIVPDREDGTDQEDAAAEGHRIVEITLRLGSDQVPTLAASGALTSSVLQISRNA